jgi:hypothetical protein
MTEEELKQMRDQVRADVAVKVVADALWRFNEEHEETLSVYDVVGFVFEGLIAEGMCPACLAEAVQRAFEETKADPNEHLNEDESLRVPVRRDGDDVLH